MTKKMHREPGQVNGRNEVFRLSTDGRLRRLAMLSALGIVSLAPIGLIGTAQAGAPPAFGSPAWLAQKGAQQPVNPAAPSAGVPGAITTPQQAKSQAQQSLADLSKALATISAAQSLQKSAAGQISVGDPHIPDGVGAGGLQRDINGDWIGADGALKSSASANGQVDVTVTQTQQRAILDWSSFNISKNTTLDFDQSAGTQTDGTNNWVALNRVNGPAAQIMGNIKAQGDVYIIDPNGILFGAGSKVDTHSLIASTLNFLSTDRAIADSQFLNGGILSAVRGSDFLTPGLLTAGNSAAASITIEDGASITTGELGFVLIAAPAIANHGTITATDGQVILAANNGVGLTNGPNAFGQFTPIITDSSQGTLVNDGIIQAERGNVTLLGLDIQQNGIVGVTTSITRPGSIVISANVGDPNQLAGAGSIVFGSGSLTTVLPSEDGETTTSSTAASQTFKPGSVTISGGSVTFESSTLLEAPGASVSISATNPNGSTDPQAGRIFIDGCVPVGCTTGAIIDVAGYADVILPVSDTMVTIGPLTANDLADSPLLRDGFLFSQTVTVDSTLAGTRDDGTPWQGSPLINASGYIQAVPRGIDQMLVNGGSISLTGHQVIAKSGSVLDLDGGYINYQGGMVPGQTLLQGADGRLYSIGNADPNIDYVGFAGSYSTVYARWNRTDTWVDPLLSGSLSHYEPGFIQGGNAGTLSVVVSRANDPSDNGTVILDGTISAHAMAGRNQVTSGSQPMGGSFSLGNANIGEPSYFITNQDYLLPDNFNANSALPTGTVSPTQMPDSANPNDTNFDLGNWSPINGDALAAGGFSSISITATQGQIIVPEGAQLTVQPYINGSTTSSISLNAARIVVEGALTAHAGSIDITTGADTNSVASTTVGPTFGGSSPQPGDIVIGEDATLDVSGEWVNDTGLSPDQVSGHEFINGGSIALVTEQHSAEVPDSSGHGSTVVDTTGGIYVNGLLDVSSGAYISSSGQVLSSNGVPQGDAGSIRLSTYDSATAFFNQVSSEAGVSPTAPPSTGVVEVNGILDGYGFSKGGTLTIQGLGFVVGNDSRAPADGSVPAGYIYLPGGFFKGEGFGEDATGHPLGQANGFGNYVLEAEFDVNILDNTSVQLIQQNRVLDYAAAAQAATGSNLRDAAFVGVDKLDDYHRAPTDLTILADDYFNWTGKNPTPPYAGQFSGTLRVGDGAVIQGDDGAHILLGSPGTVEVLGSIVAHGGSIALDGLSPQFAENAFAANSQNTYAGQSVVLGQNSVLDVSGTIQIDPYVDQPVGNSGQAAPPVTGRILDGGTVSIYADDIIAEKNANPQPVDAAGMPAGFSAGCAGAAGACIDVSGAGAEGPAILDLPRADGSHAPQQVWSDAGTVTLAATNGLYFDGSIRGQAYNGPEGKGQGGTLNLIALSPGANGMILRQSGDTLPVGYEWKAGDPAPADQAGTLLFSVDTLDGSGIASLAIGSGTPSSAVQAAGIPESDLNNVGPLKLGFAGDVSLSLGLSFTADATNYVALKQGATTLTPDAVADVPTTVTIDAPYVALNGFYRTSHQDTDPLTPLSGPATLQVDAQFIDFGGVFALDGFTAANFTSAGDIRFVTPVQYVQSGGTAPELGAVVTAAALHFTARELYPASDNSFVLLTTAASDSGSSTSADEHDQCMQSSICIEGNGAAPVVPLSAGGSLLLDAPKITQDGTLWAPAGSIILGVGDKTDSTIGALFNPVNPVSNTVSNPLTLVDTQSVTLGAGSTTSVSLGGAYIPFGTTLDGKEWQNNIGDLASTPDLTAPPAKLIQVEGASVTADPKATVDLSGGGELQAIEWVPGTGGTRDVLSQFNTSYATSSSGAQVPLYPDQRGIYALVPSYEAPVATYDPVFQQGQAAIGLGQAVHLSGGPGLPAGDYVLMPAKYATLPGAFRVVQDTAAVDSLPSANSVAPDGTLFVEGNYVNALNGARDARTTTFEIQSDSVWGQYSDYTRTSADDFFPALAAQSGSVVPQLPRDAGQLILGATSSLELGDGFSPITTAASGGAKASIDIASQNIQVVAEDTQALLAGYIELTVKQLDDLNAGSLLLGGTRSQTSSGVSINALASNIVVDDAGSSTPSQPSPPPSQPSPPLFQAPEIMLVTKSGEASDGIHIRDNSNIGVLASGAVAAASQPISIDGGGAFLMVSNNQPVAFTRNGAGTGTGGLLEVGAGASIQGGNSLILDSTGDTRFDTTAIFSGNNVTADASSIVFLGSSVSAATTAAATGLVLSSNTLGQFDNAQSITLRSYSSIDFEGKVEVVVPGTLALSARGFTDGGLANGSPSGAVAVTLQADTLILGNNPLDSTATTTPPPATPAAPAVLNLQAHEIDFGFAAASATTSPPVQFSGFSAIEAAATGGIVGQNNTFDFGSAPLTLTAPVIYAAANSNATFTTTGMVKTVSAASDGTPLVLPPDDQLGGQLELDGGSIDIAGKLQATAGNLILKANGASGGIEIESTGSLDVAGVGKQFFDTYEYAPGGSISLTSAHGVVGIDSGAVLDFSGAQPASGTQGGSDAGVLTIDSAQTPSIAAGTLKGAAPAGFTGGSFSLATGGSFELASLLAALPSSQNNPLGLVSVETGAGDIEMPGGATLYADNVLLVADAGTVKIDALAAIHADGIANSVPSSQPGSTQPTLTQGPGGSISLYGTQGVDVEGTLSASTGNPNQRGGTVQIGTSGTADGTLNSQYGYENVDPSDSGTIIIGSNAKIDVSGGSAGGHDGGIVSLRAPLLSNGDVNVQIASDAIINTASINTDTGKSGPGVFSLEAYAVWSTSDSSTGAQHFDGFIDPAGWYNNGALVSGTFTDQEGNTVLNYTAGSMTPDQLATYLDNDYFTPAAGAANADHQTFYGYRNGDSAQGAGTLMGFVENPGFSSTLQGRLAAGSNHGALTVAPGIELDNPDKRTNNGDITIASNWNLGACNPCGGANPVYLYRYQGQAPVLTVRAENNLNINASLSDGFSQLAAGPEFTYSAAAFNIAEAAYLPNSGLTFQDKIKFNGAQFILDGDPDFKPFQALAPGQAASYYSKYQQYLSQGVLIWNSLETRLKNVNYTVSPKTIAAGPALIADYTQYSTNYAAYLKTLTTAGGTPQPPQLPGDPSPSAYSTYIANWTKYENTMLTLDAIRGTPTTLRYYIYPPLPPPASNSPVNSAIANGNDPANTANLQNLAPLAYATLTGGSSTSYRLVAGADLPDAGQRGTADPLAVIAGGGNVQMGGYSVATDEANTLNGVNPELAFPTVVRTGVGSIDIAAGGDFTLRPTVAQDPGAGDAASIAPGVIYTGGAPDPANGGQNGSVGLYIPTANGSSFLPLPELIVTGAVNPQDAGDLGIHVLGNIDGVENIVDSDGKRTGTAGQFLGQFWIPWMETGNVNGVSSSINFGAFDQGVLSTGGNVSVSAGGDIRDLAVSLPTTWYSEPGSVTVTTIGGGNLRVSAGGDILSGDYFVARGQGNIEAGGQIAADADIGFIDVSGNSFASSAAPLIALQDAQVDVHARQGIDVGGVYDPSYLLYGSITNLNVDSQGYSVDSALSALSTAGDVSLDTFRLSNEIFGGRNSPIESLTGANILPATLSLAALDGGISIQGMGALYPSPYGELNLVADQSVSLFDNDIRGGGSAIVSTSTVAFSMIDAAPSAMPSPLAPLDASALPVFGSMAVGDLGSSTFFLHEQYLATKTLDDGTKIMVAEPLHAEDPVPVRVYSLEGSIIDGQAQGGGFYGSGLRLAVGKPALIQAGQDIVNLNFIGQNLADADVTRIIAGRDIYDTPLPDLGSGVLSAVASLQLAGPGTFDIEAGRNIGPLTSQNEAALKSYFTQASSTQITGIDTVGNFYNSYLPHQSAGVNVLFGIGPGIDVADFIARYVAPGASVTGVPSYTQALVAFMEQYEAGQGWDTGLLKDQKTVTLTPDQAWTGFQALPGYVQQLFAEQVFTNILFLTGQDFHNPDSPNFEKYARGYDAINTLFPASYGYTANSLDGGSNGSNAPMHTGDLDVRGSTIQTQQGGAITLLGPGGNILLASASAPPFLVDRGGIAINPPNTEGVLTLQQGDINIFTDGSVQLAQSRIFTEQGGNLLIWSSNGDINAGEGTKTTAFIPPLQYVCDLDIFCTLNPSGEVTGAGIATLQTTPNAPPGDVELVAPRGTVDAGAAGIRVSGNIVIAALAVANAFNIQVKGTSVGVPATAHIDTGALNAANSAAAAATDASALANRASPDAGSQISVEVVGFGTPDEEQKKRMRKQNKNGTN